MPTKRAARVGELLLKEVADLLARRVKDPRVKGITLTGVEMSNDLRNARIYFSLIGGRDAAQRGQAGLDSAKNFIKREISQRMELRYTPEIVFKYDSSLGKAAHMEEIFSRLKSEATAEHEQ